MRIYVAAFGEKGRAIAEKIKQIPLAVDYGNLPCTGKKVQDDTIVYLREQEPLDVWTDLAFMQGMPLVFIGAAGIAVRAIAPFIEKKTMDSPVLVIDENAQYVIPVLSGHLGGANELARQLAEGLHGQAVVTTATDCAGRFAVDLFAKKNCLRVFDTHGIAAVSTQILQGNTVPVAVENYSAQQLQQLGMPEELIPVDWEDFRQKKQDAMIVVTEEKEFLEQAPLGLFPKKYVLGIGCRKGKSCMEIEQGLEEMLIRLREQENICITQEEIAAVASIDVKEKEEGILALAQKMRVPFYVFTAGQLQEVAGVYSASEFVEQQVGVDNVCERAAVAAGEKLLVKKQAADGVTFAIANRKWSVTFDE